MTIKHTLASLLPGLALVVAPAAIAAPSHATLTIRHQLQGCHAWSVGGGPFRPSAALTLRKGGFLVVTNDDVMPHKLVETSGPPARMFSVKTAMGMGMRGAFGPGTMAHMGATTKVLFPRNGVYRFTTKPGEDYMAGVKTIGADNVLRLTVRVVGEG